VASDLRAVEAVEVIAIAAKVAARIMRIVNSAAGTAPRGKETRGAVGSLGWGAVEPRKN
jgi:hypothetical protein